jgi:hypothetical protein
MGGEKISANLWGNPNVKRGANYQWMVIKCNDPKCDFHGLIRYSSIMDLIDSKFNNLPTDNGEIK